MLNILDFKLFQLMLYQLICEVKSVRVGDISELSLVPSIMSTIFVKPKESLNEVVINIKLLC
jgi:hypothetical protein